MQLFADSAKNEVTEKLEQFQAEDTQKVIMRKFGMPIEVEFGGEKISIKPGSAYTLNMIQSLVLKAKQETFDEWNKSSEGQKLIQTALKAASDNDSKAIMNAVQAYQKLEKTRIKVSQLNLKYMIQVIQLIILDSKSPEWKHKYNGFPPKSELEKAFPSDKMLKEVPISDLNNILDVYFQINDLSVAKENFDKLGGIMP